MQALLNAKTQKSPDPTTSEGSEIGGSSFQVVVLGSTGQRTGPRHLSKLEAVNVVGRRPVAAIQAAVATV